MANNEQGIYYGTMASAGCVCIGAKNTPFLAIKFNLTHVQQNGEWVDIQGGLQRDIRWCISDGVWNSEVAKSILIQKLNALGFNGDFDNPAFSDKRLVEGIQIECTFDGNYNQWEIPGLLPESEKKPIEKSQSRVLNARWKQAAAAATKPAGKPAPANTAAAKPAAPPAEPEPSLPAPDDIPF